MPEKKARKGSTMNQIDLIIQPYRKKILLPSNMDYKQMIEKWRYEDYLRKISKS